MIPDLPSSDSSFAASTSSDSSSTLSSVEAVVPRKTTPPKKKLPSMKKKLSQKVPPKKKTTTTKHYLLSNKKASIGQKILNSVSLYCTLHKKSKAPRDVIAAMCGYGQNPRKHKNYKSFMNAVSEDRKKELLHVENDFFALTKSGKARAIPWNPAESIQEQVGLALLQLGCGSKSKQARMMHLLSDGRTYTREALAQDELVKCNPTKNSFGNLLSPLKTMEFAEYGHFGTKKTMRMEDWMFPRGRPADTDGVVVDVELKQEGEDKEGENSSGGEDGSSGGEDSGIVEV